LWPGADIINLAFQQRTLFCRVLSSLSVFITRAPSTSSTAFATASDSKSTYDCVNTHNFQPTECRPSDLEVEGSVRTTKAAALAQAQASGPMPILVEVGFILLVLPMIFPPLAFIEPLLVVPSRTSILGFPLSQQQLLLLMSYRGGPPRAHGNPSQYETRRASDSEMVRAIRHTQRQPDKIRKARNSLNRSPSDHDHSRHLGFGSTPSAFGASTTPAFGGSTNTSTGFGSSSGTGGGTCSSRALRFCFFRIHLRGPSSRRINLRIRSFVPISHVDSMLISSE
jgi:hypothetical protein